MKAALFVLAVAGIASAAETMFDALPECSHECLEKSIKGSSSCDPEDSECLCEVDNYRSIYSGAEACVLQACGAAKSVGRPPRCCPTAAGTATESSEATGTPAAGEATSTTASPDGAAAMGSIGGVGMMILGLLAAF
ncbi:hypothetical protein ACJ41O_013055 [Fusarium nematophilum]